MSDRVGRRKHSSQPTGETGQGAPLSIGRKEQDYRPLAPHETRRSAYQDPPTPSGRVFVLSSLVFGGKGTMKPLNEHAWGRQKRKAKAMPRGKKKKTSEGGGGATHGAPGRKRQLLVLLLEKRSVEAGVLRAATQALLIVLFSPAPLP